MKTASERKLTEKERYEYRSATMRLAYLAHDRPDLQFASKELARAMQTPTEWDQSQLKRVVRYLAGAPRLVQRFESQSAPSHVTVFSDSDHAGCMKTRKSTSGVFVFTAST